MAETQVQHESLLLPGYWRITTFGRLTENPRAAGPDLRIRAYLAQIVGANDSLAAEGNIVGTIRPMLLPVGEIPRMYQNAILHDGQLVTDRIHRLVHEQIGTKILDCNRENVRVFERLDRDEHGELIIPVDDKWRHLLDDPEMHGLFVAIGSLEDPYAVVISAFEVFRFFYATSDVLAKAFLRDHFLDPDTNLWNPDKTVLLDDGRAVIWLRKRMLDADARFLARFAFDNYALRQAQRIFLYSSALGRIGGERVLWALPPFQDIVRTEVVCRPIGGPDRKRVLVTRILRCDWKPPWTELKWDRDNDGRFDRDNREERNPTNWPCLMTVPDGREPNQKTLANVPPSGASVPSKLQEKEISDRFPELEKTPANKLPQEGTKTRADQKDWRGLVAEISRGSVVEGRSSRELVGRTIIEGLEQKPQPQPQSTDEVRTDIGEAEYLKILELLQAIASHSLAHIEFLVVLDAMANVRGVDFNVFPGEVDGREKVWLFIDEKRINRRMVLVAGVRYGDRWRYVIELQQRRTGECSTLVAWHCEEQELAPGLLAQLLMDCAKAGKAKLERAHFYEVHWSRLRHTTEGTDEATARHYLQRIMTATPEAV